MPGFFNLKSSHTFFLIILAFMVVPVVVNYYYPIYLQDSGYVAIGGIMLVVFGLYLNAVIQGPRYPHIEHSIFDLKTKTAYAIKDFFIDVEPRATQPVLDVWPMNLNEKGMAQATAFGGRWWYPYLVRTHWAVDVGEFRNCFLHIFVLPQPWKKFLGFGRREDAAYLLGEVISHGSSTHLSSILAPFKREFVGIQIPIYIGILSTYTMSKITEDWEEAMNAWAKASRDIDNVIKEHAADLFPQKQVEELVKVVYPSINKKQIRMESD